MKYKLLTDDKIEFKGRTLYRIQALQSISFVVREGEIGGYVENENILNQEGECWIGDNAKVFGDSKISGVSKVYNNSIVEDSTLSGLAFISGDAYIKGSKLKGSFDVFGQAKIEDSSLQGQGTILAEAKINDLHFTADRLLIGGNAKILDKLDLRFVRIGKNSITFYKDSVCGIAVGFYTWCFMPIDEFIEKIKRCDDYCDLYEYKQEAIAYAEIAKEVLK